MDDHRVAHARGILVRHGQADAHRTQRDNGSIPVAEN
jgi:hypothetical protein